MNGKKLAWDAQFERVARDIACEGTKEFLDGFTSGLYNDEDRLSSDFADKSYQELKDALMDRANEIRKEKGKPLIKYGQPCNE